MTERERKDSGLLYLPCDEELAAEQIRRLDMLFEYNALKPSRQKEKQALLKKMFASIGDDCYIETPFYANLGGMNVHFGKNVYANFGLTLVDDAEITVGDYVKFGPNVVVCTAAHPVLPELREKVYQYNLPVKIGNCVWVGAGAIILPGVTIGDNSVIGAGSVVTKDIPANVVAYGNPCRVARQINENDKKFYYKDREIDITLNE